MSECHLTSELGDHVAFLSALVYNHDVAVGQILPVTDAHIARSFGIRFATAGQDRYRTSIVVERLHGREIALTAASLNLHVGQLRNFLAERKGSRAHSNTVPKQIGPDLRSKCCVAWRGTSIGAEVGQVGAIDGLRSIKVGDGSHGSEQMTR